MGRRNSFTGLDCLCQKFAITIPSVFWPEKYSVLSVFGHQSPVHQRIQIYFMYEARKLYQRDNMAWLRYTPEEF
jgi:hypothetical protein